MEGEAYLEGRERGANQNCSSSHIYLLHEFVCSKFLKLSVMGLTQLSQSTSGDKPGMGRKYIGLIGVSCVARRRKEEWAFKISMLSTWPCWPNKRGG